MLGMEESCLITDFQPGLIDRLFLYVCSCINAPFFLGGEKTVTNSMNKRMRITE